MKYRKVKQSLSLAVLLILIAGSCLNAQSGGYSLSFDGTDDYVSFGTNSPTFYNDNITIEAWIKTSQTGSEKNILSWGATGSNQNVQLRIDDGLLTFGIDDYGAHHWGSVSSSQHVNAGCWMHVAMVKSGSFVQLYINGVDDNSGTLQQNVSMDRFILGHFYQAGTIDSDMAFQGEMDEVRVWHSARSAWEIREYMYKDAGTDMEAFYKMSNGSGTSLSDNSKNSHSGSLMNGTAWKASDCFVSNGNALLFDGTNNHVFFDNNRPYFTDTITIEAWIKSSSTATEKEIVCWGSRTNRDVVEFRMDQGKLEYGLYTGADNDWISLKSNTSINTGNWTHVCVVQEESSVKLYINGLMDVSTTLVKRPQVTNMQIGVLFQNNSQNLAYDFDGQIDEVRIWYMARTEDEIRDVLYKNINGNWGGLACCYRMNQSVQDVSSLKDASPNAFHGHMNFFESGSDFDPNTYIINWLGAANSQWNLAANWSSGNVPASSAHVNIEPDPINAIQINSAQEITSLHIAPSAGLELQNNAQLTVDGLIFNESSAESVLLKSNASGTASLIIEGEADGDISAERYLSKDIWHYISAPFDISGNFNSLNLGLTAGENNDQFYRWEEEYVWDGYTGIWVDILNGEDGGGTDPLTDDEGFVTAKGYAMTCKDTDKTLELSGTPLLSDQNISMSRTPASSHTGANLVGNPFCCDIAINNAADSDDNFIKANAPVLEASYQAVYVWQESENWDGISNEDYVPLNHSSAATFLEAAQGFMLMSASDGAVLQFPEEIRKHGSGIFYKESDDFMRLKLWIRTDKIAAFTEFVFAAGMSLEMDAGYDAAKMKGNPDIALYSRLPEALGEDFAIQALPFIDTECVIPLGIDLASSSEITFSMKGSAFQKGSIILEDRENDVLTDLSEREYSCRTGNASDRFFLRFNMINPQAAKSGFSEYFQLQQQKGMLQIKSFYPKECNFQLFDVSGAALLNGELFLGNNSLSLIRFATGIYFLHIHCGDKSAVFKCVKAY